MILSRTTRPGTPPGRRRPSTVAHATLMGLLLLAGAGCGSDPGRVEPTSSLEISWEGRPERGQQIVMHLASPAGEPIPAGEAEWSVEPEGAGRWRGNALDLESAGRIMVTARYGGENGRVEIDVDRPPLILFDMVVDGNRDIYRAALDGRELHRLTDNPAEDRDPAIAGDLVVFVSERDGNSELYSIPVSGGNEVRLTRTAAHEDSPALSPDGKRLAFVRGSVFTRLFIAKPDADSPVRPDPTHAHDGTLELTPSWSPDGSTLAFVSTVEGMPGIFTWTGDSATLLEFSGKGDFEPAWSPDGRRIVFASNRTGDVELYLLDLDTDELRRLTERRGSDGHPAWLPDGRLVYVAYDGDAAELRWLDPENPELSQAIPLPGVPGNPAAQMK